MEKHPIENIMRTTMENIRDMVDVNTIVGDPIATLDGTTIIPVSKVTFGFVAGGAEYEANNNAAKTTQVIDTKKHPFAGGNGTGVSINPIGFIVSNKDGVRMLPAHSRTSLDRVIELAPQLIKEIKDIFVSECECGYDEECEHEHEHEHEHHHSCHNGGNATHNHTEYKENQSSKPIFFEPNND